MRAGTATRPHRCRVTIATEAAPGESRAEAIIRAIVELASAGMFSPAVATALVVSVARPPGAPC
ncbi:MAG: hypothetical protein KA201_02380 [Kofleriaceae bacterium]|nr:hypothetical protein [Kofleriaceae bacterium]